MESEIKEINSVSGGEDKGIKPRYTYIININRNATENGNDEIEDVLNAVKAIFPSTVYLI